MKTKTILSLAIMAALPLSAHADPVGPAAVPANGTAVVATANAPYVTQTPTAADATHIASTAYVKGAYNDAIAAVNNVAGKVGSKQAKLVNFHNNQAIYSKVMSSDLTGLVGDLITMDDNEYVAMADTVAQVVSDGALHDPNRILISTGATLQIVREAGQTLQSDMNTALSNKRVEIYTTWENDNAKQQVEFVNAQ